MLARGHVVISPQDPTDDRLNAKVGEEVVRDELTAQRLIARSDRDRQAHRDHARKRVTVRHRRGVHSESTQRGEVQYAADHAGDSLPVCGFRDELAASGLRDHRDLRATVLVRCPPGCRDRASLDQTHQGRADGPLI